MEWMLGPLTGREHVSIAHPEQEDARLSPHKGDAWVQQSNPVVVKQIMTEIWRLKRAPVKRGSAVVCHVCFC